MVKEEGHYNIKRVDRLPKKGNANLLYTIKSDTLKTLYRWLPNNTWETIILGGSGTTNIQAGTNVTITGIGTLLDPLIINSTDPFTPTDLPTDYGVTLSTVATTNNYNDLDNKVSSFNVTESSSYGDSITIGQGSTSGNDYMSLFEGLYLINNTNRAVSARGIFRATKNHNEFINPNHNSLTTVMAGFNDVRRGGNDVKTINKINNGYKSIIVNHFLDRYTIANDSEVGVTKFGFPNGNVFNGGVVGGKSSTGANVNGLYANNIGDYMEYIFRDNNLVIGTAGVDGVFETYGEFEVAIDGVSKGLFSFNNDSDGISDGDNDNSRIALPILFKDLGDGEHVVRVTTTTNDYVPLDYFGHLKRPNLSSPIILIESTSMNNSGYATVPNNANQSIIDELNANINNLINFIGSEYPISIAKTSNFFNIASGLSGDNIHPNDEGYRQIYEAIYTSINNYIVFASSEVSTDILPLDNTFTGNNTFDEETLMNKGLQIQGSFDEVPTGAGFELEYLSGTSYITSYDRGSSQWRPLIIRSSSLDLKTDNGTSLPTGTFTTTDGKTITITKGLVTSIV